MTINDPIKFCAGLWDWGILNGCFGQTRIKPTDIDFEYLYQSEVERFGQFLRIEAKQPGVEVSKGQQILFNQLIKIGYFTVMIVWGETNSPVEIQINTTTEELREPCDPDRFREHVSDWFKAVNMGQIYHPIKHEEILVDKDDEFIPPEPDGPFFW